MQEHLGRIKNKEIYDYYIGKRLQNELIRLMGNKVQKTIVDRINAIRAL